MDKQNDQASFSKPVHPNGGFGSSFGFVLACVGSAVGMGNIWMFPYRVGQYGGGAFLVPYILFVALFGLVGLSAEFAVGRRAKTGTLGAYEYCWNTLNKGKLGYALGWIPLLGSLGIAGLCVLWPVPLQGLYLRRMRLLFSARLRATSEAYPGM